MALHPEQRQTLEREHGFAEWRGDSGEGPVGQGVSGFKFKGDELPGWELTKARRNEALDPPRYDTFWRPSEGGDALLGVQIIERPSLGAARETLLELLGDVESSAIKRRADLPIGDVAFGQEFILMFARGNLVVVVRNAGRKVVPVLDVARQVDAVVVRVTSR
jgi:hypothetical protein